VRPTLKRATQFELPISGLSVTGDETARAEAQLASLDYHDMSPRFSRSMVRAR
jgi:hypothetical protein